MFKNEYKPWVIPAVIISTFFIFLLDMSTMRGTADFIFYFIPVAISVLHRSAIFPINMAIVCTILSVLGFYASAENANISNTLAFVNRLFAIFCLWVVAFLVKKNIKARNSAEEKSWIKSGAFEIAGQLRGELTVREISENLLDSLNKRIEFNVGALFIRKEFSKDYQFIAGHAYSPQDKKFIHSGEGLLGQVVIDKKVKLVSSVEEDHVKVISGTGESKAKYLLLAPLIADNEVLGLLELAFLTKPDPIVVEFVSEITELSAMAIRSAEYKSKLSELLNQAQKYAEELQTQQEELRVTNEELEQQSKALKESHTRLENQQSELEQTNQQLEEQAQELENQKNILDEKNRELELKNEEVRKSSNYKSEFLANMSHELRTPLNSTLILAKLLADNKPGNLSKEQIEYAEIIYNSGNDLLNLINDILDLSKVEAGKLSVSPEVVLTEHTCKNLKAIFAPLAEEKNIDFKITIDDSAPQEFITDRQRLEQILKNFLSNAVKFTHEGGVSLHVFERDQRVLFAVADTGVGMTPDEQKIVFEAFRQADGTTNRKYGGTGLGLSISKELAQILNGEITLTSEKGHGSTFILSLPLTLEKSKVVEKKPVIETPAPHKTAENRPLSFKFKDDRESIQNFKRRMLIIEDDEAFAKILLDLAHEMNFGAIVTETGEEGMKMAKTYQPNAIVLDIRLPDHSGMIVLDQLKMNTKTRHIPVHVISSEDFSRSALEMGAIGYMLKPVKKDELAVAFQNMSSILEQKVKQVLIVEDDKIQRDHITQLISDKNVIVTPVESSSEALKLLSEKTFDCMIMDLALPDMSGHELLSKLSNESSTYSFPPVIVYTARDLTIEEEEKLRLYSGSIIIKGAKSPERLLSEVTLFLHKVETDLPPERQKMLQDFRSREKNLENRTILIVDDDVRNIFALTSALENHGAKIVSARNGKEALLKINSSVDLVLMDIMMPEMDGYEAMRKIRKTNGYEDLPIIALTAKAMKDDKEKCIEAGANDYLSKPIEMDKLLSLIRVWLPPKRRFS